MAIRIIAAGLLLALALAGCGAATAPVGLLPSATAGSARSLSPTVAATASPEPATPSQEERVSPTDDPTPVPSQSATPTAATSAGQAAAPATPVFQATPLVPDSAPTPAAATPPGFDKLVPIAVADLAARLAIDPSAIQLLEARSVIWPDAGLGCPEPGMAYRQVQVDGYLIRLGVGGQDYSYHGGGRRGPFLCEQKPGDQPQPAPPPGMDT